MAPVINPFVQTSSVFTQAILSKNFETRLFSPLTQEGGSVEVHGERGIGKTTVLNYVTNVPEEWREIFNDHIFVFVNCQDMVAPPTSGQFWLQITKQLVRKLESNQIQERCYALLNESNEGNEINHNDFHEILDVAAGLRKKIVLVLDDFNVLIRTDPENINDTRGFLQGLRSLTTRDSNKANLVISTRYSLSESCKPLASPNYSPFDNAFTLCRLKFFRDQELLCLLKRAEEAGQTAFSSAERNYVAYLSGFHPQLAQIAASKIFDCRIEMGEPLSDLSPVGEQFKSEARPIFESLFWRASEVERVLLMLVALQPLNGKAGNVNYDISDLPQVFSEKEREINDLTERGLLNRVKANPPTWELFSPIFQWWILKEIESEDPQQLEERRKVWGNLLNQKRADQIGKLVESVKKNWDKIEPFGRSILSLGGYELPKFPGS